AQERGPGGGVRGAGRRSPARRAGSGRPRPGRRPASGPGPRGAVESRAPRPGARPLRDPLMPERILALRPRAMGDVVLTTPAFRSLKRGHPGAERLVVTDP